jgi:hypothetical protein
MPVMIRRVSIFAFPIALIVTSTIIGAPAPKNVPKPDNFFPTLVGTKWEYALENGTLELSREVVESEEKDGVRSVSMKWTSHGALKYAQESNYRIDAEGVSRIGFGKVSPFDAPFVIFKFQKKPGEDWPASKEVLAKFVGMEEVVTPFQKFRAMRISMTQPSDRVNEYWFASDFGVVKWKKADGTVLELKSFTPGKK